MARSQGPDRPGGCPDPERIAAHAERRLTGDEAARMDEHIATCADCYAIFSATLKFLISDTKPVAFFQRPAFKIAAGFAIAASLVAALSLRMRAVAPKPPAPLVAELAQAMGDRRFVEPRLTGGFQHGRLVVLRSGDTPKGLDAQPPAVLGAVARIRETAEGDTSPAALGALGITYLVSGDVGAAVKALESASAQAPDNPQLQSDLAAAYLVRASHFDEPADLPKALESAEKAIVLKDAPPEAWFNRALALEKLYLHDAARTAWDDYLERDASSPWADEARQHKDALPSGKQSTVEEDRARVRAALEEGAAALDRLADEDPSLLRDYFANVLLPSWADAHLTGHPDANLHRAHAEILGNALLRTTGDAMVRDTARALSEPGATATAQDPLRSQALGYRSFREGMRAYDQEQPACDPFRAAASHLQAGGSPYAAWARFRVVVSCLYPQKRKEALTELQGLKTEGTSQRHRQLIARVQYMEALLVGIDVGLTESQKHLQTARETFRSTRDEETEAWTSVKMAENLHFLGDDRGAWRERVSSIAILDRVRTLRRRCGILGEAAATALEQRLPRVAAHFSSVALAEARRAEPTVATDALLRQARISQALGLAHQAEGYLLEARGFVERIPDEALAQVQRAELNGLEGELLTPKEPERAAAALSQALDTFKAIIPVRAPALHLLLARAQLARGRDDDAEKSLLAGIEAMEKGRVALRDVALQASFFEQALPFFDDLVRLYVERRQDPEPALAIVERARGRQIVDAWAGEPEAPYDPVRLEQGLPEGSALVYYVALEDRLCIWILRREGSQFIQRSLTAAELASLVARHRAALEGRASAEVVQRLAGRLYDELVHPLIPFLVHQRTLVFVPDGALQEVPFCGLWNKQTGRYLIEDFLIGEAPSGTLVVQASARPRNVDGAQARALVVGNPKVDKRLWAGLPDLPGALAEATAIAALYPRSKVLLGNDATKSAFLMEAPASAVVHYAGHAAASSDAPFTSRLLFAAEPRTADSGALYLRELARGGLPRTSVVVLAACRTGSGVVSRVEGPLSLGRPFLAAGVPSVITSLWDIDDETSRRFFESFHRALLARGQPLLALQQVQVEFLRSADPLLSYPGSWAAFIHMGGVGRQSLPRGEQS